MNYNRKHIAFIAGYLRAGGAERVLSVLANHFVNINFKVSVIYLDDKKDFYMLDEKIKKHQIEYDRESGNFISGLLNTRRRVKALRQMIKNVDPDIVIGFITDINVLSVLACRRLDVPVIISERTNPYQYRIPVKWKIASRLFYRLADKLVLQTARVSRFYSFVPSSKIAVIPNPVSNIYFEDNTKRKNIILAVGRLEYPKGFDLLIEAFAKTRAKDSWKLLIVGEGSERENLIRNISQNNLDSSVELVGLQKDIGSFYSRASLFVLSSRYEGYPNALSEAMSSGLACISFNCNFGPAEMIEHNVNGILVEHLNTDQLARAIDDLADNRPKREKIGENAEEINRQNHIDAVSEQWVGIMEKLWE